MKKLTKKLTFALLLILLPPLILAGVFAPAMEAQAATKKYVKSIAVDSTTENMEVGDIKTVNVTVEAKGNLTKSKLGVKATSANSSIVAASVIESPTETGSIGESVIRLTAKKPGTAKITIATKGTSKAGKTLKKTITVKVTNAEYVTGIDASDAKVIVKIPQEIPVVVHANKVLDATKLKVSVKSSDTAVVTAKVSANPSEAGAAGESLIKLTPKKIGSATLTITAGTKNSNGKSVTKKIKVTVIKDPGFTGNDYSVVHTTVEKTVRFKVDETKVSIDELKAQGYTISEGSKEAVRTSVYAKSVYTFKRLPKTLKELRQFDLKSEVRQVNYNGASYDIDYGMLKPAVASVLAIHSFQKTNRLDTNNAIISMFDYLNGKSVISNQRKQFINGQLMDYPNLLNCYFRGAERGNGYTPAEPFTIVVEEGPYYIPEKDTINGYRPTTYMAFIKHSGNDSGESYIDVYLDSDGNWYSWDDQFANLLVSPK